LSNNVIMSIGSAAPPYTPDTEMVPPRRTIAIAELSAASRSTPACFITTRPTAEGRNPAAA